ncbi:MAG: Rieske 2Fe-2S domain-containing protein [Euryarchaeota archaeon]|nr:Rieske 2Fe-2S domain-containing protein [Euryarchaeota archaeon]
MSKIKLASISEVPKDGMIEKVVGERTFLLASVNGAVKVMDGLCSHRQGHLAKGTLKANIVRCPVHGSEFDIMTGKMVRGPKIPLIGKAVDIKTYAPIIEGDDVLIEI